MRETEPDFVGRGKNRARRDARDKRLFFGYSANMKQPEHLRNELTELRLLFELCRLLDGSTGLTDNLGATLRLMARRLGMMRGAVMLASRDGGLFPAATMGPEPGDAEFAAASLAMRHMEPVIMSRAQTRPALLSRCGDLVADKENIEFVSIPVVMDNQAIGALSADRLFADSVSLEEDIRLLSIIASLIARAARIRQSFEDEHAAVLEENRLLQQALRERFKPGSFVGGAASLKIVFEQMAQVAGSNTTVLIRGESGTGKELVAESLHASSARSGGPFIRLNCAALPENLIESELFGHERGAFTGATAMRKGRFELAHGGTLFLDEVGDLPALTQVKLLRVLQERSFERIGGMQTRKVDVRLIAATNRPLEDMVREGAFREDLYYRLNVFPIHLPPLRERVDDIMLLARHFVEKHSAVNGKKIVRIHAGAMDMLHAYQWPGNVRELENAMERAVLLSGADGVILPEHLPEAVRRAAPKERLSEAWSAPFAGSLREALDRVEREMLVRALLEHRGNMAKAAAALGITERMIGIRMKKFRLDYREFRREAGTS